MARGWCEVAGFLYLDMSRIDNFEGSVRSPFSNSTDRREDKERDGD